MQAARFFKTLLFIFGIFLSLAATVFATGQPRRYNENSTVKGTISQSFYQVNAKTDVAVKSIAVTGTLYEKGTFGTWQKISSCSNTSASSSCSASSTAAGTAHHQHIFIPGILGVRWAIAHHQPFRFG